MWKGTTSSNGRKSQRRMAGVQDAHGCRAPVDASYASRSNGSPLGHPDTYYGHMQQLPTWRAGSIVNPECMSAPDGCSAPTRISPPLQGLASDDAGFPALVCHGLAEVRGHP